MNIRNQKGYDIPQRICPFLVWNTVTGYECTECNAECGGCRYTGVCTENEDEWELGLELQTNSECNDCPNFKLCILHGSFTGPWEQCNLYKLLS